MEKQNPALSLSQLILVKEVEHRIEGKLLKEHFKTTYESLKPINIIKNTLKEAVSSPELKTNLVNSAIGFAAGVLVKKVMVGKTSNPVSKLFGMLIETIVANKVAKNADGIKSIGSAIINKLISKKEEE